MTGLKIGELANGKPFILPDDFVVQTNAILAIKGAGKTCTASVIAEEMCKRHLLWVALDPVGVWWGLRVDASGKPGGFPVVVIGGEHADLPIGKDSGARLAEALMSEHIYAVIDLSQESKRFWHGFLSEFCVELLRLNPDVPRHLFIEEAPEFVPQRTKVELTARCKEAVERVVRLGRNKGYGCTLISQRPATVDKDVLSQCEQLFVLRTVGPHDRKALQEWIEAKATDRKLAEFWRDLAKMPNGTGWFWSPQWLGEFTKVRIRERMTFHPGATRQVGKMIKPVALSEVGSFVDKLKRQLSRKQISMSRGEKATAAPDTSTAEVEVDARHQEIIRLRDQLSEERGRRLQLEGRLSKLKKTLEPQYEALKAIFGELTVDKAGSVDHGAYAPWLEKAGSGGRRKMLEVLIERGEATKNQLATLSGLSPRSASTYLGWMSGNGLIERDGKLIKLCAL